MAASHLRMLLCELNGTKDEGTPPTSIYFDSKSAIAMGANYRDTKHTRHIMRQFHYVRDNIAANRFTSKWVNTESQLADIGTKNNDGPRHKFLMELALVKVKDQQSLIQEG
jgi:hypothetical protein